MLQFLSKAILPKEITAFERSYLEQLNKVALAIFAAHLPVFVLLAYLNDTGPLDAAGLTTLALVGPFVANRTLTNPRHVAMVCGVTSMILGGLLVHFEQGPVQIEMHFYFFAMLAMLAIYGNPMVIIAAAAAVSAHHLLLWAYLPRSVFNYDAPLWVVLVHALFVALESFATCAIARTIFSNVIGLDKIVQERTSKVRSLLTHMEQGFLTIDHQGEMAEERSAAVERWLGPVGDDLLFHTYLARHAPQEALALEMGLEQVFDDMLPLELTLGQLPNRFSTAAATFDIRYTPIFEGTDTPHPEDSSTDSSADLSADLAEPIPQQLLVVITNITAQVERERLELAQREVFQLFERAMQDRSGFREFFEESQRLVESVIHGHEADPAELRRNLHTLKGNTMLFGVHSVAQCCHHLENQLSEAER